MRGLLRELRRQAAILVFGGYPSDGYGRVVAVELWVVGGLEPTDATMRSLG